MYAIDLEYINIQYEIYVSVSYHATMSIIPFNFCGMASVVISPSILQALYDDLTFNNTLVRVLALFFQRRIQYKTDVENLSTGGQGSSLKCLQIVEQTLLLLFKIYTFKFHILSHEINPIFKKYFYYEVGFSKTCFSKNSTDS